MIGFIVGMSVIAVLCMAIEPAWMWVIHRLEKRASDDTSWANGNGKAH